VEITLLKCIATGGKVSVVVVAQMWKVFFEAADKVKGCSEKIERQNRILIHNRKKNNTAIEGEMP
jgi:hypothetical protein